MGGEPVERRWKAAMYRWEMSEERSQRRESCLKWNGRQSPVWVSMRFWQELKIAAIVVVNAFGDAF